jgi:hypothetical protein
MSSNYRELMAVLMALKTFGPNLIGKSVQILTDNVTTAAFINRLGGASPTLAQLAQAVWLEAHDHGIHLTAKHLAGRLNTVADALSRVKTSYSWQLHPALFQMIDRVWGRHTIDRFASMDDSQLPIYNSYFHDPLTSGVDALSQSDWAQHNNWVNAPFRLIPRVLDIVRQQRAQATIIAPWWPAQPWTQTLLSMTIATPIRLPLSRRLLWQTAPNPEPLRNRKWRLYAWRISGEIDFDHKDGQNVPCYN